MQKKYILFDLDGTLISSVPDICREINLFLSKNFQNAKSLDEKQVIKCIGDGARIMLQRSLNFANIKLNDEEYENLLKKWLVHYENADMYLTKPWPNCIETLSKLKATGHKLAVVTNKPKGPTKVILEKLELAKYFDVIVDADSLPERKPNPEPLLFAIKKMNGSLEEAIMIGDSETDALAAKNANIPVVLFSFGYAKIPFEEINPDYLLDDFSDLIDVCDIKHLHSPNFNDRKLPITHIILHYTGMKTAKEAIERLCDENACVSSHYVINTNGIITQLVDEEKRAYHAGVSFWKGTTDINSASIGIEIVNPGHEFGYIPFTSQQILSVISLCKDIMKRHNIKYVLAHSDVAPTRKQDPGELFPWNELNKNGIGIFTNEFDPTGNGDNFKENLSKIGYDITNINETLIAFQRHFYKEGLNENNLDKTYMRIKAISNLL
ncbi:MAG: HAD-IA family hydrolase [Alphaproteobacteria bacterium]|nr:HAD-IA family hydrolase [Alphaproteobacteria bacterium]